MGQILHGCARTRAAVRRAIQSSQESLIALAERYDINPKTVHKWRKCSFVSDAPMGPICVHTCAQHAARTKCEGFSWAKNGLRHSFISYRLAILDDTARVALEAGNSPQVIFGHYRELVTPEAAKAWFEVMPD